MRALVTGGGGFLGRYVVEALLAEGAEVTSISRGAYPELEVLGVRHVRADLADGAAMRDAFRGQEVVFHVAAKAGIWGPARAYERANVLATQNVIAACEQHKVKRLVFTSSPSVVFDGRDHMDAKADLPYPARYLAHYPRTKAIAERTVLEANGRWGLATCALRPHLVFGPRDPHLVPRLLERARSGRLAIVGSGKNLVSMTYVENAARAHLDAARKLRPDAEHAGRAYFVSQAEPVRLWDWIGRLLEHLDIPRPERRVSLRKAYAAGLACELLWRLTRRASDPPMTRFVAQQLGTSHAYDMAEPRYAFGYREGVDMEEATRRLYASLEAGARSGV